MNAQKDQALTRDSTGGLIIVLIAWSIPVSSLIGRVIDKQARLRSESTGEIYYYAASNWSGRAAAIILVAAIVLALILLARITKALYLSPPTALLLLLILWWSISTFLRPTSEFRDYQQAIVIPILMAAVCISPPTERTVLRLRTVLLTTLGSTWLFYLVLPDQAASACRVDKCGILGNLLIGYFPQENFLALLLIALMPSIGAFASRGARAAMITLTLTTVLASGGRISLAIGLIVAALVISQPVGVSHTRKLPRHEYTISRYRLVRWLPLLALAGSFVLFYTTPPAGLTGRGAIWMGIREAAAGYGAVFGPGRAALQTIEVSSSSSAFTPQHEHGLAPHLIGQSGYVGLTIMGIALLVLAISRTADEALLPVLASLGPAIFLQSLTETVWRFDVRSPSFFACLLFVGCAAAVFSRPATQKKSAATVSMAIVPGHAETL